MQLLTHTAEKTVFKKEFSKLHTDSMLGILHYATVYLNTGSGGQGLERLSLSAEDLVMAMHKASSRRIEVLSRTTGNVDQVGSFPVVLLRDLCREELANYARGINRLRSCSQAVAKSRFEQISTAAGRDISSHGTIWYTMTHPLVVHALQFGEGNCTVKSCLKSRAYQKQKKRIHTCCVETNKGVLKPSKNTTIVFRTESPAKHWFVFPSSHFEERGDVFSIRRAPLVNQTLPFVYRWWQDTSTSSTCCR